MFILQLNPMRGKTESMQPVARADTAEQLVRLMELEKVDLYTDEDGSKKWNKVFRRGSVLEWCNAPTGEDNLGQPYILDVGTVESWIQKVTEMAIQDYQETVTNLPAAEILLQGRDTPIQL